MRTSCRFAGRVFENMNINVRLLRSNCFFSEEGFSVLHELKIGDFKKVTTPFARRENHTMKNQNSNASIIHP